MFFSQTPPGNMNEDIVDTSQEAIKFSRVDPYFKIPLKEGLQYGLNSLIISEAIWNEYRARHIGIETKMQ